MLRSIAVIVAAIRLSEPKVEDADAQRYAVALQKEAQSHDFDPLTGVAIIFHESRFNPKAVSRNGEDLGLAQIRARYIGACKHTRSPVKAPTAACRKVRESLLSPEDNIRTMAELITANRRFCKKKIGSDKFHHWLASYQGRNNVRKKRWCAPGKGTWQVIATRRKLLSALKKAKKL